MSGLGIVADQFTPRLPALREELLAITARNRIAYIHRPRRQLDGLLRGPVEEAAGFSDCPEIGRFIAPRLEDEISSVACPVATAFIRRAAPVGKKSAQIVAIRRSLPDGAVVGFGIVYRKAQNRD